MIIKGSSRGQTKTDTSKLAQHLLSQENEEVEVVELAGVGSQTLETALEEMRLVGLGSRATKLLYHASISLDRDEAPTMGKARWLEAVDELEQRLGLTGHQRAVVRHIKRGREHVHIVWCRVHPWTLKLTRDSNNYRTHEECSRALEERWNLRPVVGVHTRDPGTPRPVAMATHADWQTSERTGIPVRDVADALRDAWRTTKTGREFSTAINREGFHLANGRKGIIAVDSAGTPHSLPRRLGLKAEEVRTRLSDLNPANLPSVSDLNPTNTQRRNLMKPQDAKNTTYSAHNAQKQRGRLPGERIQLSPDYWREFGYEPDELTDCLLIRLPTGTLIKDRGDHISIQSRGEPTDDDIRTLVSAGKARGWEGIRFSGGSPEWQHRARLEALRQGYPLSQITLECEEGKPQPLALSPMPAHIRNKIIPPEPDSKKPELETPDLGTAPTPFRP